MESETEVGRGTLRPFGFRVIAVELEEDRPGRLTLPAGARIEQLRRAVVEALPPGTADASAGGVHAWWQLPAVGEVVYFREGWTIGDRVVIESSNIVAVEGTHGEE